MIRLAVATCTPEVQRIPPVALLTGGFEVRMQRAADLGFAGVELMVARPDEVDVHAIRRSIQSAGLAVAAVASGPVVYQDGITLVSPDPGICYAAWQRLYELIDLAAEVDAPLVTIGSLRGKGSGDPIEMTVLEDILRNAASQAEQTGVRLALEPLNRYETTLLRTAEETQAFIARVGSPALGMLLDTFHMNIEEANLVTSFRETASMGYLQHIHIADSNRLPPGKGHLDFPMLLQTLNKIDYSGYLSAELFAIPDPDQAAAETMACLLPILAGIQ